MWTLYELQKNLTRGIIKRPSNSIISKHFEMNLRWSERQRLNYNQMSTLIKFSSKSFMTCYSIQYHKMAFHSEFFLSVPFILQMELYFPGLVKNHSRIGALGYLESAANKKGYVTRKKEQLVKNFWICKRNFQLAKFTF